MPSCGQQEWVTDKALLRAQALSPEISHCSFPGAERAASRDGLSLLPSLCPQYFKYEFPEGVDSVIVKVTSTKAFPCSVISIQDVLVSGLPCHSTRTRGCGERGRPRLHLLSPPQCPVYDLDNNVAFIGMYQTMTKKAAITVQVGDARGPWETWRWSAFHTPAPFPLARHALRCWVP